jgi:serine/threonine protein kinase
MATGKKAFEGKSQGSLIAKILETDPPPISSLQPMTPPALDRVVKKCLAKEPDDRWQTARDLTDGLRWIAESGPRSGMSVTQKNLNKHIVGIAAAIVILETALITAVIY